MGVKEKCFLELKCNCIACQTSKLPTMYSTIADSREQCYRNAIKEGWYILRNRKGELLALGPHCLVSEENKKKFDLEYGLTEDEK